jgi:hypothetical protein
LFGLRNRRDGNTSIDSDEAYENAGVILISAIKEDSSYLPAKIALACIRLHADNDHDEAVRLLGEVVDADSENAAAHYHLADVFRDEGDDELALSAVNKSINLNPRFAPAYLLRSHLLRNTDLVQSAADESSFEQLRGQEADHYFYPWTVHLEHFKSRVTGLTLEFSTEWFVFDSPADNAEIRLTRRRPNGSLGISVSRYPPMGTDEAKLSTEDWRKVVVDGFEASMPGFRVLGNGTQLLGGVKAPWFEFESKPIGYGRVFVMRQGSLVWTARYSATSGRADFLSHLPDAMAVLNSIQLPVEIRNRQTD